MKPMKRTTDILLAAACLAMLWPLMLVVAVVTLLQDGRPVLYSHERVGYRGARFRLWKFRTMRREQAVGQPVTVARDARITPLGRWLRAFKLDELPQLINVLRGEMSLVGPRPCTPYDFEQYLPWHKERLNALPGLTGLWQVSGRSSLSFEEMVKLDLYYVEHWSLWFDLKILFRTIGAVIRAEGAY